MGLLHHLIEEVVDAKAKREAVEAPQVLSETARRIVVRLLKEVEESPSIVPSLARPAAGLHGVRGVTRQAQQAHQADGVVRAVDRAQVGEAILDLGLLIEAAATADLVGNALALERPREIVQMRVGAQQNGDRVRA